MAEEKIVVFYKPLLLGGAPYHKYILYIGAEKPEQYIFE